MAKKKAAKKSKKKKASKKQPSKLVKEASIDTIYKLARLYGSIHETMSFLRTRVYNIKEFDDSLAFYLCYAAVRYMYKMRSLLPPDDKFVKVSASWPREYPLKLSWKEKRKYLVDAWAQLIIHTRPKPGCDIKKLMLTVINKEQLPKKTHRHKDDINKILSYSYDIFSIMSAYIEKHLLDHVHNQKHSIAMIAMVEPLLEQHMEEFICRAHAVGPYSLEEESTFKSPLKKENGKKRGVLIVAYNGFYAAECTFMPDDGDEYVIWGEGFCNPEDIIDINRGPNFPHIYKQKLFDIWDYRTGEYIDLYKEMPAQKAYWCIPQEEHSCKNDLEYELIDITMRLKTSDEYKELANRIINIYANVNSEVRWYPGKVPWTYVKDIETIIVELRHEMLIYELNQYGKNLPWGPGSDVEFSEKWRPVTSGLETGDIPIDHQTPPMSKAQYARYRSITCEHLELLIEEDMVHLVTLPGGKKHIFDRIEMPQDATKAMETNIEQKQMKRKNH